MYVHLKLTNQRGVNLAKEEKNKELYVGDKEKEVEKIIDSFEANKSIEKKKFSFNDVWRNGKIYMKVYIKEETQGKKNLLLGLILIITSVFIKKFLLMLGIFFVVFSVIYLNSIDRYRHIVLLIEESKKKEELIQKKIDRHKTIIEYGTPTEREVEKYNEYKSDLRELFEERQKESIKLYSYRNLSK